MANYRIWISTDNNGTPKVGAHMMDDNTVASERIYPSQMTHRCTARNADGSVVICTPTEARDSELEILHYFPAADGRLGRGVWTGR